MRSHLDRCPDCRREYEATLQLKRLFGRLGGAEPERSFDPSILDGPSPSRRAWVSLGKSLMGQLRSLTLYAGLNGRAVEQSLRPLRSGAGKLALSGVLAVSMVSAALLRTPQHADAVSAHVPVYVGSDDGTLVFLPLDAAGAPGVESLPDEVREVQASLVLGAEAPIRPAAYTSYRGSSLGIADYRSHRTELYPGDLGRVVPVTFEHMDERYR